MASYSNWGSSGGAFGNWGGGGTTTTTPHYGALPAPTAPTSKGMGFWGEVGHFVDQIPGHQIITGPGNVIQTINQNLWSSSEPGGMGLEQLAHSFYAAPYALGHLIGHDLHLGYKTTGAPGWSPSGNLHEVLSELGIGKSRIKVVPDKSVPAAERGFGGLLSSQYWHDPRTIGGGLVVPLGKHYEQKYWTSHVLSNIEHDPLGTLLDLTVAGKLPGVLHMRAIERAAQSGELDRQIMGLDKPGFRARVLAPRIITIRDYPGSEGFTFQLHHEAATSFGRYLQHMLDEQRFGKIGPEGTTVGGLRGELGMFGHNINVPFGPASAIARARAELGNRIFMNDQRIEQAVRDTYKGLPDNQVRAIAMVIAEGPRDIQDPIEQLIQDREARIQGHEQLLQDALKAGEKPPKGTDRTVIKALQSQVAQLRSLDKAAIYAENPKLQAAVDAIRKRGEQITDEAIKRGQLTREQVEQRRFGTRKVLSGGAFKEKHVTGGVTVPDRVKIEAQGAALREMKAAEHELSKTKKKLRESLTSLVHGTQGRTLEDLFKEHNARLKRLGKKPRTFSQYAKDVYPKRAEMTGPVGRAILRHQTMLDQYDKQLKIAKDARDRWQERRPPMTASGKGRQHHMTRTERVTISAGLRGGKGYEQLAEEERQALEAYARRNEPPPEPTPPPPEPTPPSSSGPRTVAPEHVAKFQTWGETPAAPAEALFVRDKKTGHYTVPDHPEYHIEPRTQRNKIVGQKMVFGQIAGEGERVAGFDAYRGRQKIGHGKLVDMKARINRDIAARRAEPSAAEALPEAVPHEGPVTFRVRMPILFYDELTSRLRREGKGAIGEETARNPQAKRGTGTVTVKLTMEELKQLRREAKSSGRSENRAAVRAINDQVSTAYEAIAKSEQKLDFTRNPDGSYHVAGTDYAISHGEAGRYIAHTSDHVIGEYAKLAEAKRSIERSVAYERHESMNAAREAAGPAVKAEDPFMLSIEQGPAMTYARAQAAGELPPLTVKQPPAETPPVEPPIAAEPPPEQPPPVVAGPPPEPAYGPLAQYGPSFRAPHRASTTNIEGARIYTRARAVLVQQGMADQWKTNKYTLWMRGQIANNPELFHMDHLDQARWFATQDIYENFVLPMSGKLDPQLALDGGKRPDEFYVRTRPSAAFPKDVKIGAAYFGDLTNQEKDAIDRAQYDYVTKDLQDSMRIQKGETDGAWAARMEQAGIRRISGDVARIWQRDTRPTSVLRRVFLRNGLNQIWRFFLLGIKPAWSAWNSMTNESLLAFRYLFTKGGGTAFFNSMVDTYGVAKAADLIKRQILHNSDGIGLVNMRQLMQSDPRLAELFAGSLGEQFNRQLQHVGALSDQWNRSIAKRTVRLLAPYSTDFAPVRLLRGFAEANYRFNIHAENAARAGAAVAEISQVTGKMVRTVEDLQQAMKTMSEADFDTVRHGVLDALGNYSQLGSMEREWIVTIAPFYPWFKTIMGITAKWVTRHPERLWVLGVMGSAFMTAQNQDYQVGVPLPGFASEAIPAGKPRGGVQPIIQPQGINPLATPLDIINTARSLAGDPNAQPSDLGLALLGPAAQFAYVALTNRDPFFGGTYAGPGAGLPAPFRGLGSLFETPQYRAIQEHGGIPGLIPPYKSKVYIMPGGSSSIPGLSNADMLAIEQYWGVPLRYGDLENLRTRGLSEQGKGVSTQAPAAPPAYHSPTQATSGAYSGWGG